MSGDYDDLLNRTWEEIPKEQVLPTGNWLLAGKNVALVRPKKEDQSLKVLFSYIAKEPVDNVDEEELAELVDSGYDLSITRINHTIYIETAADWDAVRTHLAKHGVELKGNILDGNGRLSFAKDFRGSEVVAYLDQKNWEDDAKQVHWENKPSGFAAIED